jgi:hypothetical protein
MHQWRALPSYRFALMQIQGWSRLSIAPWNLAGARSADAAAIVIVVMCPLNDVVDLAVATMSAASHNAINRAP